MQQYLEFSDGNFQTFPKSFGSWVKSIVYRPLMIYRKNKKPNDFTYQQLCTLVANVYTILAHLRSISIVEF
jgi:hypothetical protein